MKVVTQSGGPERRTLIGLVVSKEVLSRVASRWDKGGMFASEWGNLLGQWCVDYYERYRKAPGKHVQSLYEAWAADTADKATAEAMERFLTSLSGQHSALAKEINPDLVIDQAGKLFNKVRLQRHRDAIEGDLENGDIDKALARFDKFRPVEMGGNEWVDVLRDEDAMRKAFQDKQEPLITFPGDLGEFFVDAFERDAFVAIQAPEKRGKSFWLLAILWQALKEGRKVAMFEAGDLSQSQLLRRIACRATRRPIKPCTVKIPTRLEFVDGMLMKEYDEREFDSPLSWGEAVKANAKLFARTKTTDSPFPLSVHPNSSLSVPGIRSILSRWESDGWQPDFVIVDYADILANPSPGPDSRDQINTTWKMLRRMSQELHCCVVTATQADADSYEKGTQSKKNFSEDKRKYGHVTATLAINQLDTEKKEGLQRLNWLALREGEFIESKCVIVAGALAIANPCIKSVWDQKDGEK